MRVVTSLGVIVLAATLLPRATTYAMTPPEPYEYDPPFPFWEMQRQQTYRVDNFIRMAMALQSLDRSDALDELHSWARDPHAHARVIVLARMLFVPRAGSELRSPGLGRAVLLGGTDYSDWPQEPIEIVDGVPFLITGGYELLGAPERDEGYLRYCETNGDWTAFKYDAKTAEQKRDALQKLLASDKWKVALNDRERKFFSDQIE
jgi:hypothetical protein